MQKTEGGPPSKEPTAAQVQIVNIFKDTLLSPELSPLALKQVGSEMHLVCAVVQLWYKLKQVSKLVFTASAQLIIIILFT